MFLSQGRFLAKENKSSFVFLPQIPLFLVESLMEKVLNRRNPIVCVAPLQSEDFYIILVYIYRIVT